MLDYRLFGPNPVGHHIVSVLIHIANALLLFWILTKITGAIWPSAFVAAVFAVHPLHVESVAWVSERKDVLSGLFWMLTMLAYARYAERPNLRRYVFVLLAYAMGLISKPMVVTLPFVLLLLDYWPLNRLAGFGNDIATAVKKQQTTQVNYPKATLQRLIVEKVPLFVLSAFSCAMTLIAQQSGGSVATLEQIPIDYRIANAFISYTKYIGKMIWPSRLAVNYPYPHNLSKATVIVCTLLFIFLSVLSIYICRRKKYVAAGWLWYVGTLVPVIGLVQVGVQAMADRYMYMPMLGLLIIAAWSVKDLVNNRPHRRFIASVLVTTILSSSIILSRIQVKHWQNSLTLWEQALKVTKNNYIAENNYASALSEQGRFIEAERHSRNAIQINPKYFNALLGLGDTLLKQKKFNEAIACFNDLLKQNEKSVEVHYDLGVALSTQKKYEEAIKHFAKVLEIDPNYPDARSKMEITLIIAGRPDEAIAYFNEILRTSKDPAEEHTKLGVVYTQAGKYELAIQSFTKAVELKPNSSIALNNLAWAMATTSDVSVQDANKAINLAERACELTGHKDPGSLDTLAAAYAAAGRFEDAVKTAQKAIDAAKAQGQNALASEIEKRLELYRAGKRYIQK
jgi:tetratricopeptide (TPR) repeat protein